MRTIHRQSAKGVVELVWEGSGRVWQVLRAENILGPWLPASPVIPDLMFDDPGAGVSQSLYRLQQW